MTPAPDATSPASQVGGAVSVSYDAETGEFTATPPGIPAVQSGAVDRVMAVLNYWFDGTRRIDRDSEMVKQLASLAAPQSEPLPGGVGEDWQSVAMWMGFAASVIKAGESWTDQCQREYDEAKRAFARLSALSGKEQG